MKAKEFLDALADDRIVMAIRQAEARTSGEIRIFITRRPLRGADVVAKAKTEFVRLRIDRTGERNGVLFFVAPREQQFAVIGDEAVHARCGQEFWDATAAAMQEHFREGRFTEGVIAGVRRAGDLLDAHFPRRGDDRNELSDEVERD